MLKRILYILLILIIIGYFFSLNLRIYNIYTQIQKIGEILYQMNNKSYLAPSEEEIYINLKLQVTAYNSEVSQTDSDPNIGAWNNKVRPGMIAVSRDLESIGLTNGVTIIIEKYNHIETIILDKMNTHKTVRGEKIKIEKSLDIWMESKEEAIKWGVKYLTVKVPLKCINVEKLIALI